MGWFRRRKKPLGVNAQVHSHELDEARDHLTEFVCSRLGVEAYLEPATAVTPITVLLVAQDGEWTRRRAGSSAIVDHLTKLNVPVFEIHRTGYPQRMRDYNERARLARQAKIPDNMDAELIKLLDEGAV